jgi:type VI secretion system protein ImpK
MSEKDQPPGPFGRGERTIIRPNPAGRRPTPAAPGAPASPYPQPPVAQPGAAPAPPVAAPRPMAAPPQAPTEEWIKTPNAPAAPAAGYQRPDLRVDDLVAPNENPIMRAASPLLLLLGRLRVALLRASFASLMEQVAEAIQFFEKDIRSAGIPEDQANTAKYILCATADDIVQNIPTEDRHVWTQYSMLSRFFGERIGGVRFFQELDRVKIDPLVNYPLLELFHACLALGFQGLHRHTPTGQTQLQQIQRNLYETLRRVRPKVVYDLSPRWQGQRLENRSSRLPVPLWAIAGILSAALFGLFLALRTLLGGSAEAAADSTSTLHPIDRIEIARRIFAPPPPPPPPPPGPSQAQRIQTQLPAEVSGCKLQVDQSAKFIIIRVCDTITFAPGQAVVLDQFKPIAARIAAVLQKEPGAVKVVGHTDSTPIKNVRFPSNWHLSVERAKAVAALLKQGLSEPQRVGVEGKGADVPVAPNDSPDGRAKNRRVEVLVARSE